MITICGCLRKIIFADYEILALQNQLVCLSKILNNRFSDCTDFEKLRKEGYSKNSKNWILVAFGAFRLRFMKADFSAFCNKLY